MAEKVANNPLQNVTFPSGSGTAHGYLALPPSGSGPGVIVIQEWWGLTDHIAAVADRLAQAGFVALAPDLFGGRTTHDAGDAGAMMQELPEDQAARDLGGAVDYLQANNAVTSQNVGVVGFCMGGGFALTLAAQQGDRIGAVVPFYGVGGVPTDFSNLSAAVQGHYGENDAFYPIEDAKQLEKQIRSEAKSKDVEFFYYPAGHAFHNSDNLLGTYDESQAKLAWQRTVNFLEAHLT
jgi:carboxymethylenebutenolidase